MPLIEKKTPSMHKLLFDQNLSFRLVKQIEHVFPESNHVRLLNLDKADDLTVWQYAKDNNFHIVSKDSDFYNITTLYGYPPKVIRINIGNASTKAIIKLFEQKEETIKAFLDNKITGLLELD